MSTRRWVLVVTGLVIASACASPPPSPLPPAPPADGLRVMTYNLLGVNGDDAVFNEHAGWAARIDQINPDVVVLEEAQAADVQAIVGRTSTAYVLVAYAQWECDLKPEREGVAILVKATIATLGGGGTSIGESCVNPTVKRVMVWADLDLAAGPLRVYGTHLSQPGVDYDGSRNNQIRLVKSFATSEDHADDRRWVLAGDLNVRPGDSSYRLLTGADPNEPGPYGLVDSWAQLTPDAADPVQCPTYSSGDATGMAYLWANPDVVRRCGYSAGWPKDDNWLACNVFSLCVAWEQRQVTSVRERLDYVLIPEGGPVRAVAGFVPNRADDDWAAAGQEWFRLSDHLPYVVDLDVNVVPR